MRKFLLVLAIILAFCFISSVFSAEKIKYGGIAVLGLSSGLNALNYNPFSPTRLFGVNLIYEPLLNINVLTGDVKPWLAMSYEWRNNNLELVFNLRKDVKWSDGTPFTAKDVVFTFNLLKKFPALDLLSVWNTGLESITAEGDYTVVFKFSKPNVPAFYYIATTFIVPEHVWSKVEDPVKFNNPNPVGTGPFLFKNFDTATSVETFVKNPDYWQKGKPYIDGVKIINFKTNEANIMAIIKGETDWSSTFIPDVNKVFISRNPKVNHAWVTQGAMVSFIPNVTKYPLNIAKFRLAIAMALDKEKIAKYGEYGYTPPAHPTGLRIPLLKKWFDKSLEPLLYSYNPEKAVELIESLGFERNAEGWFINPKTGEPLSFDLYVVSGWTDWVQSAQIIEDNLKKIGIKLNVKQIKVNVINEIEDRIILRAEKKGKGQLKAGDFKSEVPIEIVNPDLVIANLVDDNANIDMELWVMKGFGYVPVERFEENFKKTFPEGTIFVDAWFSPVQKVNFRVENIRIRERTDYEKLTFEIWTDGRVSPKFALNYGFNFLKKAFDKCSKEIEAAKVEEKHISYEKKEKIAYLLKQPIEYLELSKRILKSLKEHGIYRIRDIIETDKDTLLKIKNFGKKSLEELERKLAEHDLKIGMNLEIYLKEE